jgi:hypothetical protein
MADKPESTSSIIFRLTLWWTIIFALIHLFEIPLINSVFIFFYGPVVFTGNLCLLILLLISVIYWIRQRSNASRPFTPFVLCIFAIIFIFFFPFSRLTLEVDFRVKRNEREKIVKMITDKTIPCDLSKSSIVTIPSEYANLSAGSSNVLVEAIDNTTCVFFYTFRGLTDNSSGFVYVPDEKVMSKIKIGRRGSSVIFYDPIEITKIADHWYFIANT